MLAELEKALSPLPPSPLVLVTDTLRSDGGFLLVHFLLSNLKAGKRVCFVGLEQSLFHYTSVARKLVNEHLFVNNVD